MKREEKLAEVELAPFSRLSLHRHDGAFCVRHNGQGLMHEKLNASELTIGELACEILEEDRASRILIGGLGLGFTLKSVLENSSENCEIDVFELVPEIVEWNKSYMKDLNGHLLENSRVHLHVDDVMNAFTEENETKYDAIILDIDNGPVAMVSKENKKVYQREGLRKIYTQLTKHGRVAVWSAQQDDDFKKLVGKSGFEARRVRAKTHANAKSFSYFIYIGDKLKGRRESIVDSY